MWSSSTHSGESKTVIDHSIYASSPGLDWMIERISLRRFISDGIVICELFFHSAIVAESSRYMSSSDTIAGHSVCSCILGVAIMSFFS